MPIKPVSRNPLGPLALLLPLVAWADDTGRIDVGVRLGTTLASGVPANDMPVYGIFGLYRWSDRWTFGVGLDRSDFDYEEPARLIGIPLDPAAEPIDAKVEATILSAWIERSFSKPKSRTEWFLGAGLGAASLDVPDVTGPTLTGGTFAISTEADTEIIVSAVGGVRRQLGDRWFVEFALRADQHFADWQSTDAVTGGTRDIDEYFAWGGTLGFGYRF